MLFSKQNISSNFWYKSLREILQGRNGVSFIFSEKSTMLSMSGVITMPVPLHVGQNELGVLN